MLKLSLQNFFNESSIHGFQYFTKEKTHKIEKVFWFLAIVCSCLCSGFLIYKIGVMVQQDLTVTYTSETAIKVTDIPFPAVTFCFELIHSYFSYKSDGRLFGDLKRDLLSGNISIANLTSRELRSTHAISVVNSDDFLTRLNITPIPTDDMIFYINLRSLNFKSIKTQSHFGYIWGVNYARLIGPHGFCNTFNIVDPDKLYRNLEHARKYFNFSRNSHEENAVFRFHAKTNNPENETYPLKVPISDGVLSLFVEPFTKRGQTLFYLLSRIKSYPFYSPKVYVHNPYESYTKDSFSFNSNRREKNNFFIEPKQILIDETLKSYSAKIRQCYFQPQSENDTTKSERALRFFKVYTKANCRHECVINKTFEICGCVQFFMIYNKTTRICGIHDIKCYQKVEFELGNNDECKCYPYCGEIIYNVKKVQPDAVKKRQSFATPFTLSRPDNFIAWSIVGFREPSFYPYVLKRQFTELDFISYIGGAFGLFLGFSILSFVEICYYFSLKVFCAFIRIKRRNRKVSNFQNDEKSSENELKFYLENSTIHGMNQIGMKNRSKIERLIWLICLIGALVYSGMMSYEIYEKYRDAQIAITYDSSERSVEEIPFPAITFNHETIIDFHEINYQSIVQTHDLKQNEFLEKIVNATMLESTIIPGILCKNRDVFYKVMPFTKHKINNFIELLDKKFSYINWFKNQSATWKGKFKPEFLKLLTRNGFGFSFNLLEPEKLFHENVAFDFLHSKFFYLNLPIDAANKTISHQNFPISGSSQDKFSITLTLNKEFKYEDICSPLQFIIHSPYEIPNDQTTSENAIAKFDYAQDLEIVITPEVIKTDSDLKSFDYKRRNCYFDGEKQLKMFKIYTRQNCIQECYSNFLINYGEVKCITFHQIRNETNPVCSYQRIKDEAYMYRFFILPSKLFDFDDEIILKVSNFLDSCECLDRCDEVKYNFEMFQVRLKNKSDIDTIKLTFQFKYETFLPLIRHHSFTFDEFLGQAGGLLGLFAGISFLSIFELFYFVILRQITNFVRFLARLMGNFKIVTLNVLKNKF
ncbi:hypothetical protein PVAND_015473 [Polypedilum vanderplanki]|uniref:Uncharacterized protein n=1 Tax=Polypedilum vanderplanki TaxID=319348 RepID=A0A9J6BCP3_POLVA|nr:hypothetical protein PVAND_015473 [Polypedilum vanderplanki]